MKHYQGLALTFIQVVIFEAVSIQVMGLKVVKVPDLIKGKGHLRVGLKERLDTGADRSGAGSAQYVNEPIAVLTPALPMTSMTLLPRRSLPSSSATANANGSDADTVFPNRE